MKETSYDKRSFIDLEFFRVGLGPREGVHAKAVREYGSMEARRQKTVLKCVGQIVGAHALAGHRSASSLRATKFGRTSKSGGGKVR